MRRSIAGLVILATAAVLAAAAGPVLAQGQTWGTLKGQVVWKGAPVEKKKLNITQDKEHCLAMGDLYDEELVVNPKNSGVKWVFVWLAPATGEAQDAVQPVHP